MVSQHTFRSEHTETWTTSAEYGSFYEEMRKRSPYLSISNDIVHLVKNVDSCVDRYVDDFREAVLIECVYGSERKQHLAAVMRLVEKYLLKLKIKYEKYQAREEHGKDVPPIILGWLGADPDKKTLCIYAHTDVSSPKHQQWNTDPWVLEQKDGRLFGKGIAAGKGPLIMWFHAIEMYQANRLEVPVNLQFVIEGAHEAGSPGLEELLNAQRVKFGSSIDYAVVCDGQWLGERKPCVTYGCVGFCRFEITVSKIEDNETNLNEALDKICQSICDGDGNILIPELNNYVEELSPEEERDYDTIDFDFEQIRVTLPENKQHWDKTQLLMHFWRTPRAAFGETEACACKSGSSAVRTRLTVWTVPKLTVPNVAALVTKRVVDVCGQIKCKAHVQCDLVSGAEPWKTDHRDGLYEAAKRASLQYPYKFLNNLDQISSTFHCLRRLSDLCHCGLDITLAALRTSFLRDHFTIEWQLPADALGCMPEPRLKNSGLDLCWNSIDSSHFQIYHLEADVIREDHTLETILLLRRSLKESPTPLPILLLPLCYSGSKPAAENENLCLTNFIQAHKLLISFLRELAHAGK